MSNNPEDFSFREIFIQLPNKFELGALIDKNWFITTENIFFTRDQVILKRNFGATIPPFKYGNTYVLYISQNLNLPFTKVILELNDFKVEVYETFQRNIQTSLHFKVINASEILSKI